jgi:cobalamin synthase
MSSDHAQTSRPILLLSRFLFPIENRTDTEAPSAWSKTARWLPFWGLAIGVLYAIIYRGAWKWFGEYQHLRLLPPVALLIADFGFFGYRPLAATVGLFDRRPPGASPDGLPLPAALALILIVLLKFAMLVVLPAGAVIWPADWRQHLGPLYPAVLYRPLVLMPLWGRWAMLLALCIGRVSPHGSDRLRRMAAGARLTRIIGWWFLIALLTVAYSSATPYHLAYGVVISLAILLATYLASFALARRFGGQTETTVHAAGLIGELALLMFYLPVARYIYWY